MGLLDKLQHAWNVFTNRDSPNYVSQFMDLGNSSSFRPDRMQFSRGNERSIVTAIYNRIAIDCASIDIRHVRLDDENRFTSIVDSSLNECLSVEANKDQTGRALIQDIVQSMFDEGCVAVVPVDTNVDASIKNSFDILSLRTGKITQWFPNHVSVELYNDETGTKQTVTLPKKMVAIIENPLYAIINERNSVLQRLVRAINLADSIDEQNGSGKLNLIVQLPYIVKSEARKKQAEDRRQEIETQLAGSKYGIAYTDGTEHITQLNRPIENNLTAKVEYLTRMLYSQLGTTEEVLNGSADEKTMLNYTNRTIEPIMAAIVDEFKRKFLTKTARTQHQSIVYFNRPFKMVPVSQIAEIADKFTRNEIMSSNEVRQIVGFRPIEDAKADELRNKNLNPTEGQEFASAGNNTETDENTNKENNQNG